MLKVSNPGKYELHKNSLYIESCLNYLLEFCHITSTTQKGMCIKIIDHDHF